MNKLVDDMFVARGGELRLLLLQWTCMPQYIAADVCCACVCVRVCMCECVCA